MNHSNKKYVGENLSKRAKVYICSGKAVEFKEVIKSLEWEGFDVIAEEEDERTIDRIYDTLPEIIIIDSDEDNSGISIYSAIKQEQTLSSIPVLFTGTKEDDVKFEVLRLGALDYIEKPFISSEVYLKLRNFIDLTRNSVKNSLYDMVAGVYSRIAGEEIARRQLQMAEENNNRFSVLLIEIDGISENDLEHGRTIINEVVRDSVQVFRDNLQNKSFIYRYSRDKFVVIILNLDMKEILSFIEKVKAEIKSLSIKHGMDIGFTGGVAGLSKEINSFERLLNLAEESLDRGKLNQRGTVYIHSSSIETRQRKSILIIDEDPVILSILLSRYTNRGYSVLTSQTGFEALQMLDGNRIDLIITDLIVPGITGNEIIRSIREKSKGIKILALSSQKGEDYIDSALKAGADEYVIKPFSPVELDLRIQRLIG